MSPLGPTADSEQWRPIPDWEGYYEVSTHGRVRSVPRVITSRFGVIRRVRGCVLAGRKSGPSNGVRYRLVSLYRDGEGTDLLVHRLVLAAFVGVCPLGMEGAHNDGDPANNRLSNLRYATHRENVSDKPSHGTHQIGRRNGNARLTESDVREIRQRLVGGESHRRLGAHFSVSPDCIRVIAIRRTWGWLDRDETAAA